MILLMAWKQQSFLVIFSDCLVEDYNVAAALYGNYCEFKYFLAGHKDIIFEEGLCEWNGADDLFEKFRQNELWMQGFCCPHAGESCACM